jgi:hypothetical protein
MSWNPHTQTIAKWRGNDRLPLPEPCDDARCQFCQSWYGLPAERSDVYERRAKERARPERR